MKAGSGKGTVGTKADKRALLKPCWHVILTRVEGRWRAHSFKCGPLSLVFSSTVTYIIMQGSIHVSFKVKWKCKVIQYCSSEQMMTMIYILLHNKCMMDQEYGTLIYCLYIIWLIIIYSFSLQDFINHCRKEIMLNKYGSKVIRLSSANTYSYQKGE